MGLKQAFKIGRIKLWTVHREELRKRHELQLLGWECTMNCNFFCKHCGSGAGKKVYKNEIDTDTIKRTFKEISEDFNPKKIHIAVTGGEPLLRKDLFEVMGYVKNLGFTWGMVTNGFLINESVIKDLKKAGITSLDVSIDGIGKTHDELRSVPGAYEHAINAIKLLAKANFLGTLRVTSTISKKNIEELDNMYDSFHSLGITGWRLVNVEPIGRAENSDLLLNKKEIIKVLDFIKSYRKKSAFDITFGCNTFLGYEYEDEVRNHLFFCNTGINIATILHNGDIFACPNIPRYKELIQGNIKKDRFSEVWNNKFKIFRHKNRTSCASCCKCPYWNECLGGSFHSWDYINKKPKVCFYKYK